MDIQRYQNNMVIIRDERPASTKHINEFVNELTNAINELGPTMEYTTIYTRDADRDPIVGKDMYLGEANDILTRLNDETTRREMIDEILYEKTFLFKTKKVEEYKGQEYDYIQRYRRQYGISGFSGTGYISASGFFGGYYGNSTGGGMVYQTTSSNIFTTTSALNTMMFTSGYTGKVDDSISSEPSPEPDRPVFRRLIGKLLGK